MATNGYLHAKISEIYRLIYELKNHASKEPGQIEKVLSSALEDLSIADVVLKQQNEEEMASTDAQALVHELQIHQIELEMQNEELKRTKLEAEDALMKYSDLYDFAPIGLFTFDIHRRILEVNLAGAALLGRERRSLPNRRFEVFVAHEDRPYFDRFCKAAFETDTKQMCELRLLGDNGSKIYVHIEGTVTSGKQCRIAVIDITECKRMERELRAAHGELELKIQGRTLELQTAKEEQEAINKELQAEIEEHKKTEDELSKAKEAAEAAADAKAAFLANMSHEIRTPMNAVIGFASLLLDEPLTPDQRDYIERIKNGGEALLSVIGDILEFSRAEKEKIVLEHHPFSLKRCIEESLDMVSVQAKQKGLSLTYTINYGTSDTIIGDPGRIGQILVNLLSNAVKFTDSGDISVSVFASVLEGDKRQITFEVRDTGIGMPLDKMDRLFKPFTQLEYTISRKRDGTGLGLAICRHLVELMGGEIWAESEEGHGSIFRFTIQAETIQGRPLALKESGRNAADVAYENLSSQKPMAILVAEDNLSNRKVLVEMLKRFGYRADAVSDGCEVLQALRVRPYDLVFMDIKMPEMDGFTATKEIRKLWPDNGPKVVAITAFAIEGDREKCLEAGMDGYIAKPVRKEELAALLRNITPSQE